MTRRYRLLLLGLLGLGCLSAAVPSAGAAPAAAEPPTKTPIKHVITLLQQNHTFDNYFGTYPGANGIPADACMPLSSAAPDPATCVKPYHIGDNPIDDLNHSATTFRGQYNDGQMNGFIEALDGQAQNGTIAMGYYDERDIPFYWNLADEYVLFDRYFTSARAGSVWNRMFWVAGVPGSEFNRIPEEGFQNIPTIFDRLQERGISWKFYINNYNPTVNYRNRPTAPLSPQVQWSPILAMDRFIDDPELASHIVDLDEYYTDLQNGTLPAVSYVLALGATEHPLTSLELGERTTRTMLQALMQSDAWPSSAFMISYDDWGGWYDHVVPPQVDEYGYGFRVPALLVSPYARRGFIDSTELDHTSVLRFIEDNWGVPALGRRDAQASTFTAAFDFAQTPRKPQFILAERATAAQRVTPRRDIIYGLYGAGLGAACLIIGFAAFGAGLRRRAHGWLGRPRGRATS